MLVIADSSPLIVLTAIEQVQILPALFHAVTIPPQVAGELMTSNRSQALRDFMGSRPPWLNILSPTAKEPIAHLQPAETAAIYLAEELKADLLLIDEIHGRRAAAARRLKFTGTIGVLEMAATANLPDLNDAFDRVKQTDFWISHRLLDERLNRFLNPPIP